MAQYRNSLQREQVDIDDDDFDEGAGGKNHED